MFFFGVGKNINVNNNYSCDGVIVNINRVIAYINYF